MDTQALSSPEGGKPGSEASIEFSQTSVNSRPETGRYQKTPLIIKRHRGHCGFQSKAHASFQRPSRHPIETFLQKQIPPAHPEPPSPLALYHRFPPMDTVRITRDVFPFGFRPPASARLNVNVLLLVACPSGIG